MNRSDIDKRVAIGWTIVRVAFGLLLSLAFGRQKLSGDAMTGFVGIVGALGFPFPAFFAWCSALTELVGGLMFAAGAFTRITAALVSFNMLVALYSMRQSPFVMAATALAFLLVAIAGVVAGGGPLSVDAYRRRHQLPGSSPQVAERV